MIRTVYLIIGFVLIFIIVSQTSTENIILRKLFETGFFLNYNEAKNFLIRLTWFLISSFLFFTLYLSFSF